eukprot:TRINITY_DN307_c0_g1_i6.p1 TRINITY_DN307_c0_g1~~TRINITY_DN307_c0_g1_i6.p1  ORF type:complete len:262 (+),score=74.94 TRINITY_DN307_c0_g1_i6:100-786(+)
MASMLAVSSGTILSPTSRHVYSGEQKTFAGRSACAATGSSGTWASRGRRTMIVKCESGGISAPAELKAASSADASSSLFSSAASTTSTSSTLSSSSSSSPEEEEAAAGAAAAAGGFGLTPAITLSENALKHLRKLRGEQQRDLLLRLGVRQGGCSGFSYVMEFEERANVRADDSVIECEGFAMVCDPKSLLYLYGMRLDYSDALIGGGFSFTNPNATSSCGCGKSFAA